MKKTHLLSFLLMALVINSITARERISLNEGWKFSKIDSSEIRNSLSYEEIKEWMLPSGNLFLSENKQYSRPGIPLDGGTYAQREFDDSSWRILNLPHDWGIEGPFTQEYAGTTAKLPWWGVAWYRKEIFIDEKDAGKKFILEIDGSMSYTNVWCNGYYAGGWPYGYASFSLDLTPYLNPGKKNVIAIRLDNPDESSRWYPGGGIYRNVWLVKKNPVSISQWGTFITTPEINKEKAIVWLRADIDKPGNSPVTVQIKTEIFKIDTNGKTEKKVLSESITTTELQQKKNRVEQKFTLNNPELWDLESPHLYQAVTTILQDGKSIDTYKTTFGIRTIEFTANDGFHLNGKRIPLKGVCMHHDLGSLGAAFNYRAMERQLEILQEMGVNAIRTAHNPPAPEFLDLCDKMGLMVIDEFSDTWKSPKKQNGYGLLFDDWHEQDIRAFIRRDRNHPSIILWSTGNEINEQVTETGPEISRMLTEIVREEDTTRPTTVGCNLEQSAFNGFQYTFDVYGFNYKPYLYKEFHEKNPSIPFFGSETSSCISSRGEYLFPVDEDKDGGKIGFHVSSYDLYAPSWATPPDWEFKGQDKNPASAGEFVWTGFDYLGEPTPFDKDLSILGNFNTLEEKARAEKELNEIGKIKVPSRSSYFGIVDMAGFKKDRFYIYQARWRPELPMAHILPHWNWPDRIGKVTPVHVYTSGDEAELFLNGKSLGRKIKGTYEYRLKWEEVVYEPGELKVLTYKNDTLWAEDVVKTSEDPASLFVQADRSTFSADGNDLIFVSVEIKDKNGLFVPTANNLIQFEVSGPAEIIATDNGDPTSHESFRNPYIKAFNGLCLVILRSIKGKTGEIQLKTSTEGMQPIETKLYAK
ncbi:MAG: DUF4982 domain-containing protein [Candidatus Azobacteroides sp.]|nr:DUF4982 domain-containing protein [Candidatus Azobacteroides sp.]